MKKILIAIVLIIPVKSFALSCNTYRLSCISELSSLNIDIIRNSKCENWNDLPSYEADLNNKGIYSMAYNAPNRTHNCVIGEHEVRIETTIEDTRTGSYECSGVPASMAISIWVDNNLSVDNLPFSLFCRRDYRLKGIHLNLDEGGVTIDGRGAEIEKSYFYLEDDTPVTLEKVMGKKVPPLLRKK